MKRKRSFIWLLTALLAMCLAVLQNWQEQDVVPAQTVMSALSRRSSLRCDSNLMKPR